MIDRPEMRAGEIVRILEGAFRNFVGIVQHVANDTVTGRGGVQERETLVDCDRAWLERLR